MRLRLYVQGTIEQMQHVDVLGKVLRVRPATKEEIFLMREREHLGAEIERLKERELELMGRLTELESMQGVHASEEAVSGMQRRHLEDAERGDENWNG